MAKPMATGSIKEKLPSWIEFNLLMEKVTLDDPIGHLFVVDIEFDHEKATECQIMCNEIFSPLTDKQTVVLPNERSVFQLLELYSDDHKGMPKSYKATSKYHSNLLPKRCVPIYLEELKFAITRCGWKITKLYNHYYFEQERYKHDFILTNQKFRQETESKIESDFWKLLNNSNFGYDCRNNLDNCYFQPIKEEMNEPSFIRRYYNNLFDKDISQFITSRILEDKITRKFNDERQKLTEDDPFFSVKMRNLENRRKSEQETADKFKQKEKKSHKKII